ncbi:MAG: MFS transporter, partial [Gammaproteobacteria bacterium]
NAGYTGMEAVRTRQFWFMLVSFFLVGVCATGSTAHLVPLLQDRGVSATQAAQIASMLGIAVIFGRILAGWLMDRLFAPFVGIGFMIGPIIGLMLLALGATGAGAYLAATLVGLAIGAEVDILGYFTSRYGGLKSFGLLYGFMLASFQFGGGIGPAIMGLGFDRTGSYTAALWTFSAFFAITCVLFGMLGPYPKFNSGSGDTAAAPAPA